jgi:hypothetical protein
MVDGRDGEYKDYDGHAGSRYERICECTDERDSCSNAVEVDAAITRHDAIARSRYLASRLDTVIYKSLILTHRNRNRLEYRDGRIQIWWVCDIFIRDGGYVLLLGWGVAE